MGPTEYEKPPYWYYMIASFGILWYVMGILTYAQQVVLPPEMLADLNQAQREYYAEIPPWITTSFAVGVWGGFIGCILMLFRNGLALYVLIASMIGMIVDLIYTITKGTVLDLLGFQGLLFPILIFVVSMLLVVLAGISRWRLWIE